MNPPRVLAGTMLVLSLSACSERDDGGIITADFGMTAYEDSNSYAGGVFYRHRQPRPAPITEDECHGGALGWGEPDGDDGDEPTLPELLDAGSSVRVISSSAEIIASNVGDFQYSGSTQDPVLVDALYDLKIAGGYDIGPRIVDDVIVVPPYLEIPDLSFSSGASEITWSPAGVGSLAVFRFLSDNATDVFCWGPDDGVFELSEETVAAIPIGTNGLLATTTVYRDVSFRGGVLRASGQAISESAYRHP